MSLQSVMPAIGNITFSDWPEPLPHKLKDFLKLDHLSFLLISGKNIIFFFLWIPSGKVALALLFPWCHLSLHITCQKRVQRFPGKIN